MVTIAGVWLILHLSCTKSDAQVPPTVNATAHEIPVDTANRMILSYLNGINYRINTNETRSFTTDPESLISYLSDSRIKTVKIFLAHNLDYINSGHEGERPVPNENAITLIIAGLDSAEHYVTDIDRGLYDQLAPCPDQCIGSKFVDDNE